MKFFSKKKKTIIIDPIANVETLMKEFDVPSWLQIDLVTVLKTKEKTMSNEDIRIWLNQMSTTVNFTIPEEFQDEKNLVLCFNTYKDWVESEINVYAELTYEDVDMHLKNLPSSIQRMNRQAQKAYLAISTCLLNIFSQLD